MCMERRRMSWMAGDYIRVETAPQAPCNERTRPPGPAMPDPGAWKKNLGGALLSRGRLPQYPRHWGPSLPCSEWERVLPPRHGHQGKENGGRENRGKYAAARHER